VLKFWSCACAVAGLRVAITAGPALALQTVVTQVDKNTDGAVTYHFTRRAQSGRPAAMA
jgi:hypothetical protein